MRDTGVTSRRNCVAASGGRGNEERPFSANATTIVFVRRVGRGARFSSDGLFFPDTTTARLSFPQRTRLQRDITLFSLNSPARHFYGRRCGKRITLLQLVVPFSTLALRSNFQSIFETIFIQALSIPRRHRENTLSSLSSRSLQPFKVIFARYSETIFIRYYNLHFQRLHLAIGTHR